MPCDSGPRYDDSDAREARKLKALLCTFCAWIEAGHGNGPGTWPLEVRAWWAAHAAEDARRREQEALDRVAHEAHLLAQRRAIDRELDELRKPR